MSRSRMAMAALAALAVVALTIWQVRRQRQVDTCIGAGKEWHGPTSTCVDPRPGPILQRDLKRT